MWLSPLAVHATGLCMDGNIYCRQKCPTCGAKLVHDERRGGFFCTNPDPDNFPKHEYRATGGFYIKFPGGIRRASKSYDVMMLSREAAKAATGHTTDKAFLRYCQTEGEEALMVHKMLVEKRKNQDDGKVVKIRK